MTEQTFLFSSTSRTGLVKLTLNVTALGSADFFAHDLICAALECFNALRPGMTKKNLVIVSACDNYEVVFFDGEIARRRELIK